MAAPATCQPVTHAGLPAHEISLPGGDRLVVAEHGAQVLSWRAQGRERLYLSPRSVNDGQAAVRGGIPVCFPQFNQRGPHPGLPKHGFVRNLHWQCQPQAEAARLGFTLASSPATRGLWPADFAAELSVALFPGRLEVELAVRNTGAQAWAFTGALHTYLAVDDVAQVRLHGLGGQPEWDSVADRHAQAAEPIAIAGEFDRVYTAPASSCLLQEGGQALAITASPAWANTVVWNPGAERCPSLPDLPADGWRHMLCVEAAQVFEPIPVQPGATWRGFQHLEVR